MGPLGINPLLERHYEQVILCLEHLAPILRNIDNLNPDKTGTKIPIKNMEYAKNLLPSITKDTFHRLKAWFTPGTDSSGDKCVRILPSGLRSLYGSDELLLKRASLLEGKVREKWNRRHRQTWINKFLPQVHRSKDACQAAAFAELKSDVCSASKMKEPCP